MRASLVALVAVLGTTVAYADTPQAQYRLEPRGRPHADVPFQVQLVVEGFDESPAPDQPKLDIAGATVTPLGVTPNVSRSIQIVNGRRIDSTRVTWLLRWQVVAHAEGQIRVPGMTVTQGSKSATVPPGGDVPVDSVPTTDQMKVQLVLPDRPVFVGETVPVKLVWLFIPQPEDQTFAVPMLSLDAFTVGGPPAPQGSRKVLQLVAGAKDLELPYDLDKTTVDGTEFNRVTVTFYAAPRKVGKVDIPPTSVVSALRVGRPDFFGQATSRLFRATDSARTLEVKPLPETDRPPSFAGAVGEQFSIEVRTSRSVVQLGEPVELAIKIKSDQRLDTLALGKLDGEGRLPKDRFTVPAESPTGELSDDGKSKTFKVVAQVTGPTTEIPALAFAYFDPKKAVYQTIHSEPIALSVKGGTIVGAEDVIGGSKRSQPAPTDDTALGNIDLALSSVGDVDAQPLGGVVLWVLVGILYLIPLTILVFRSWQLRTAESREEAGEVREARKRVEALLDRAKEVPARELAGPLVASLRELARVLDRPIGPGDDLLSRLETEAFAPDAAGQPLSPDLRSDAAGLLRRWTTDDRRARAGNVAPAAALAIVVFSASIGIPANVRAEAPIAKPTPANALDDGRAAYQYAMQRTNDPTARRSAFARAAVALGEAARTHPEQPELLADWGNAALGAGDVGTATLAYRRALALDASNARARHNLAWLRSRQEDSFRPIASAGAADTLLFFHHWSLSARLLVGGAAFAIAILLLVPWSPRRRRLFVVLSLIPFAVWIAMLASIVLENHHTDDAVVMDGVVMRAADSAGAPATLSQPLPRGAEVTILERRDTWTRIALANGMTGWVPDGAVERVGR